MTPSAKQKLKGTAIDAVVLDELEDLTAQLAELRQQAEPPPASLPTRQQRRRAERQALKRGAK